MARLCLGSASGDHDAMPVYHETGRIVTLICLALVALLLTLYLVWNQESPFFGEIYYLLPHLYTIPVVLVSLWYPKKGFQLVLLLIFALGVLLAIFHLQGYLINPVLSLLNAGVDLWLVGAISIYIWYRRQGEESRVEGRVAEVAPTPPFSSKEDEVRYYIAALRLSEEGMRIEAARALGDSPGREARDALIGALNDDSRFVREEAARSLGKIGDAETASLLVERLDDEYRRVREGAVRALGEMGEKALDRLIDALQDPRWRVRLGAAIALRISGDRRALPHLERATNDGNRFVRREAVKSLGRIGDRSVIAALERALHDEDETVRTRAVHALERIRNTGNDPPVL